MRVNIARKPMAVGLLGYSNRFAIYIIATRLLSLFGIKAPLIFAVMAPL
jgi:hypothetical protein